METLTSEEVLLIHSALVAEFREGLDPIEPAGVANPNLLESALARQTSEYAGVARYSDLDGVAASLLYGLVCNHAFFNGNKRTALVATLVFLDKNDATLVAEKIDLFRLLTEVASHTVCGGQRAKAGQEVEAVRKRLRAAWRGQEDGERIVTYRRLRTILSKFNCSLEGHKGNRINLVKSERRWTLFGERRVQRTVMVISYRGDSTEVPKGTLKEIRRKLKLDRDNGVDSEAFYDSKTSVDEVIAKYQSTLRRLGRESTPRPRGSRDRRRERRLRRREAKPADKHHSK